MTGIIAKDQIETNVHVVDLCRVQDKRYSRAYVNDEIVTPSDISLDGKVFVALETTLYDTRTFMGVMTMTKILSNEVVYWTWTDKVEMIEL